MSNTSCTTTGLNVADGSNPRQDVAVLTQTSDDKAVSKLGQPISPAAPSSDSVTSGMSVPSIVPVSVKPVDRRTVQGSYAGDSRADHSNAANASVSTIANPPNPREAARQAPLSGKQTPTSAPISTANVEEVGA